MFRLDLRVALLVALLAAVVLSRPALGDPCKPDGTKCSTNPSCCGKVCVKGATSVATCCTPAKCAPGACGMIPDGTCPDTLDCGSCTAPDTCGGGGTPHVCGCTPTTCAAQGKNCGQLPDGCGGTLDCGACSDPQTCGGGGTPNVCGGGTPTCANVVDAECKLVGSRPCLSGDACATGCCCESNCFSVPNRIAVGDDPAACGLSSDGFNWVGLCNVVEYCSGNQNCQCPGAHCSNDADCCHATEFCTAGVCTPKQPDGTACQFSAGCINGCCCTLPGASGPACATFTDCTAAGVTCAP